MLTSNMRLIYSIIAMLAAPEALAQGPDLVVSHVGSNNSWTFHGESGGQAAYSFRNTTCNQGNMPVNWNPVLVENLYQVIDGGIRQISAGFAIPKTCALNMSGCGTCQVTLCDTLGIGCANTSAVNDGAFGWGRWQINGNLGTWNGTPSGPCCEPATLAGRVFAPIAILENPTGRIIAESLFINEHDQSFGNGANNASWTEMLVPDHRFPSGSGTTAVGQPAIFAWQDQFPDVQIEAVQVTDEGGPGVHGYMWVGSRAVEQVNGIWNYYYSVQNLTSERGVGSVSIHGLCDPILAAQANFTGAPHHSGSPYDSTPWSVAVSGPTHTWSTETFANNPNANAIRWGTLHTFVFTSPQPPAQGTVELGLFKPGVGSSVTAPALVPSPQGIQYPGFCNALPTSLGGPMQIMGSGSPSLAAANLQLTVTSIPPFNFGYFLMSLGQGLTPLPPGSQGNLCLGGPLYRFNRVGEIQFSGAQGQVTFQPDPGQLPGGVLWIAGSNWNFQYWTRDTPQPSNFSNLVSVTFCN